MTHIARTPGQIGTVLNRFRGQAGLTQSELGDKAGLRQATISKIEKGAPTNQIGAICDVLAALDLELHIVPRTKQGAESIEDIL